MGAIQGEGEIPAFLLPGRETGRVFGAPMKVAKHCGRFSSRVAVSPLSQGKHSGRKLTPVMLPRAWKRTSGLFSLSFHRRLGDIHMELTPAVLIWRIRCLLFFVTHLMSSCLTSASSLFLFLPRVSICL